MIPPITITLALLLAAAPASAISLTSNGGGIFGPYTQITPLSGPAPGVPVPPAWLGIGSMVIASRRLRQRIRNARRGEQ